MAVAAIASIAILIANYMLNTDTQKMEPQEAYPFSSCEGTHQGVTLGLFSTASDCHGSAVAQERSSAGSCPMFMFALPHWGCRCCYQSTGPHGSWNLYHTVAPPSAAGAAVLAFKLSRQLR